MRNKKKYIVSFHVNSSSGLGGLETFMRSMQKIAKEINCGFLELSIRSDYGMMFNLDSSVIKYTLKEPNSQIGIERLKERQLDIESQIKPLGNNNIIIIFSPYYLSFFTDELLEKNKVILVQSNKLDMLFDCSYEKNKLGKVDLFTVFTDMEKYKLNSATGTDLNKIKIIPRGCKLKTAPSHKYQGKKLVAITRIDEKQKNFDGMIEIMSYLPNDYTLDIYGTGTDEEVNSLKRKIKNIDNINLKVPTAEVATTLSRYSVFLMTSHYEGIAQAVIEARSQGVPVVAYNTFEAVSWIIKDKETGYLIESHNAKLFANRVIELCENSDLYEKFSKNSLFYAQETDNQKIEKLWEKVFLSI